MTETIVIPVSLKTRKFAPLQSFFRHPDGPVQDLSVAVAPRGECLAGELDLKTKSAFVLLGRMAYDCLWMQLWCSPRGKLYLSYDDSRIVGLQFRPSRGKKDSGCQ
jgi:hypothetical protein